LRRSLILRGFGTPKPVMRSDSYGRLMAGGNLADATAAKNPAVSNGTINYFNKIGAVSSA
jgi:hypothetical protein